MSIFELVDKDGDTGMLVVGGNIDTTVRIQADEAGRPDERLLSVEIDQVRDPVALAIAAGGVQARLAKLPEHQDTSGMTSLQLLERLTAQDRAADIARFQGYIGLKAS